MSDIQEYIDSGRNLNTKKKTEQCIGLFRQSLNEKFVLLQPEYLDHHEPNPRPDGPVYFPPPGGGGGVYLGSCAS